MQLKAGQSICPLCRRSLGSESGVSPSRLCEDCRQVVHSIRTTGQLAGSNKQAHIAAPIAELAAPLSIDASATIQQPPAAEPLALDLVIEPPLFVTEPEPDRDPFDFDELFADLCERESADRADIWEEVIHPVEPAVTSPDPQLASGVGEPASDDVQDSTIEFAASDSDFSAENLVPVDSVTPQIEHGRESEETVGREDSPQPWNYPVDDYLLLTQSPVPRRTSFRMPLAAALMLGCCVAGYYAVYRPLNQGAENAVADARSQTPGITQSATVPTLDPQSVSRALGGNSASAETEPQVDSKASAESNPILASHVEPVDSGYSLQAAAFPDEAGANKFSQRLRRTGVPAYVVPAEIAGRGTWFRVRIGRFESVAEADRFASEARQRARAGGITLQLIVSRNDRP